MTKRFPPHPSEELLEEYVFHRLPEELVAQVEEHLLICEGCQKAIRELDAFRSTMKAATAPPAPSQWWPLSTSSRLVVGSTIAMVLVTLVVFRTRSIEDPVPVPVTLSATRGFEVLSEAPAGTPLAFTIEAPDLTIGQVYGIAVVDATGGPVWTGTATNAGGKLVAQATQRLGSGVYWIRLYDAEGRQLREFGISVK